MSEKLTKAQMELLRDANNGAGAPCVRFYKPAQKLVELGLAEWSVSLSYDLDKLCITDAGREALARSP